MYKCLLFTIFVLCAFSCAREVNENARIQEERLLHARIQTKYLDTLHKTESGIYYMIQAKGSGKAVEKECYVYVRSSTFDFFNEECMWGQETPAYPTYDYYDYYGYSYGGGSGETKLLTSDERVAKQLGYFSHATYYGPHLWFVGWNSLMEGIEEVVLMMREGDKRRIWIPSWLTSFGFSGSTNKYAVTTIHDVEVLRVVSDIEKFQIDSLESYRDRYYPGLDSLSYGFYKKTLVEGTGDTLKEGNRVNISYITRLLDHFIVDLNIADTAKKYNMYNSSAYIPLAGECKEDETVEIIGDDGNATPMVAGFSKAIFTMKHGEEAVVFFYSELGYGAGNSNDYLGKMQPYSPLLFYIKVERTNWEDDDV